MQGPPHCFFCGWESRGLPINVPGSIEVALPFGELSLCSGMLLLAEDAAHTGRRQVTFLLLPVSSRTNSSLPVHTPREVGINNPDGDY